MDCREVQKRIDELSAAKNFELEEVVMLHLQNCPKCQRYYDDQVQVLRVVNHLSNQQPELKDPDTVKTAILSSIENERKTTERRISPMLYMIRFLTAATVALLVTLGVEQYTVLRKVQHLETQLGKVEVTAPTPPVKLYKSSVVDMEALLSGVDQNLSIKKMLLLLQMKRFADTDFTYKDMKRNMNKDKSMEKVMHFQQQELKKQKP